MNTHHYFKVHYKIQLKFFDLLNSEIAHDLCSQFLNVNKLKKNYFSFKFRKCLI